MGRSSCSGVGSRFMDYAVSKKIMYEEYVFSLFLSLIIASSLQIALTNNVARLRYAIINILIDATVFNSTLALTGNPMVSGALCCAIVGLLCFVSNAKRRTLGEPLVFSDLIVIFSFLRYPKFYLSAISVFARCTILLLLISSLALLASGIHYALTLRLEGAIGALVAILTLFFMMSFEQGNADASKPDLSSDVARMGLTVALVVYFLRWRREPDPAPEPRLSRTSLVDADIVCVVQCESFFVPGNLADDQRSVGLPALARIQAGADQCGRFMVNHFGAYTMRSEYGVMFGRSEAELGYRYFDPYLTARREVTYSLANRLADAFEQRVFMHPHDLSFYDRGRLMPAAGFTKVIGPDAFGEEDCEGRYVGDDALAGKILEVASRAADTSERLLIYAVTMENHGPWSASESETAYDSYIRHLEGSDRMLDTLDRAWAKSNKKIVWIFYGDHRPSIPGIIEPSGERFTSYFIKSYGFDETAEPIKADISPDELHDAILMRLHVPSTQGLT